ncbi:hypothetical protein GWR56_17840 [Mucilaginibacter sp. 14171R-50]|uniref:hypothetical protein n=1 Tax=Mucilaginibacter sp. 14171R-50 TaxID=2703789 RepID=UPI00138D16F0|nr:hypothetical protein [Mucilaginibacter sp. 14171R-50]QHS57310.1 hypothetical protein GWR56_17840 [Mucilaginibacter sp. 14171R-50]
MKNKIIPLALLLALASCGNREQKVPKTDTTRTTEHVNSNAPPEPGSDEDVRISTDTSSLIKEYSTKHYFSDLKEKDAFTLKLYGKDLSTSKGLLEVKNARNQLLYQYRFSTIDLLIDPESMPESEQAARINEIFKHYFDEDKFRSPAITGAQAFEEAFGNPNAADKADWEKIKANKQAIRFSHREGYEGMVGIAYSKERKKAMPVYYSD